VKQALTLAAPSKAKLWLLHVLASVPVPISTDVGFPCSEVDRKQAEKNFRQVENSREFQTIDHCILIRRGSLADVVSDVVYAEEIDLVVLGTHGRSGLRKILMGSSAEEVCRIVSSAVLTIGPHASVRSEFRRILFATDFLTGSLRAANYAIFLGAQAHGNITMLHVVDESEALSPRAHDRTPQGAFQKLKSMFPLDSKLRTSHQILTRFGLPAQTILNVAEEERSDLIVMGVRKTRVPALSTHLPDTVESHVAAHACCPLLTVRG
jgi:nucleotide-binding universal stress UspA family protein